MIYIYALSDPRDGIVRYLDYAKNRISQRQGDIYAGDIRLHNSEWLQEVIGDGVLPTITILDVVHEAEAMDVLRDWMDKFNESDGRVESFFRTGGSTWTEARRKKFHDSRKGKPINQRDPEGKRAAALKAAWERRRAEGTDTWGHHTPETKKKISITKRLARINKKVQPKE